MRYKIFFSLYIFLQTELSHAQIIESYRIKSNQICSNDNSLIIISGYELARSLGSSLKKLSLISLFQNKKNTIVMQIDQKDLQGRYILNNGSSENADANLILREFDELVFRKQDLGERLKTSSELLKDYSLIEIEVVSEAQKEAGWVYLILDNRASDFNRDNNYLIYNSEQDIVTSSLYKIGFSKEKPFLLNAFHWYLPGEQWTPDLTDSMKIRHLGKFFGFLFKRTDDDYFSQLIDVKTGPLRIIRRTENKVKIFWKLKSPALTIDYVMMPDGFVMDSLIDIPFKTSFFFSDLATITTMDWNDISESPQMMIKSPMSHLNLPVNGKPSEEKLAFNQIKATEFSLSSKLGQFYVKLEIPDDFPISAQLYLKDALQEIDLPENYSGQFGNVGFKTTGWENIDTKLHHLKFTVCLDDKVRSTR